MAVEGKSMCGPHLFENAQRQAKSRLVEGCHKRREARAKRVCELCAEVYEKKHPWVFTTNKSYTRHLVSGRHAIAEAAETLVVMSKSN